MPLLYGKSTFAKRSLYWHFPHHRKEGLSMGAAIRNGNWKYIYQYETQKEFLYNLEEDISEEHNLVSKFPRRTKELSKELKQWQHNVKAKMPAINN